MKGGVLAVETTINDPNLAAKISSRVERGAEKGSLHTSLDMYLDKSDLHALGLVQDSIVNLRGTIQAELTGSGPDDVLGTVDFSEMSYNNGNNYYYIDRIRIASEQIDSLSRRLSIESETCSADTSRATISFPKSPLQWPTGCSRASKPTGKRK